MLHRLIWMKAPACLRVLDAHLTGGRLGPFLLRVGHYLMDENHPLVLVGFHSIRKGHVHLTISRSFSLQSFLAPKYFSYLLLSHA